MKRAYYIETAGRAIAVRVGDWLLGAEDDCETALQIRYIGNGGDLIIARCVVQRIGERIDRQWDSEEPWTLGMRKWRVLDRLERRYWKGLADA